MHLRTDTRAQSHFANVPTISRSRNGFSIAKKHVTTIQFDYLYPLYWKYIYPGDTLNIHMKALARLQTQIAILHDDLYFDMHAWFAPFRLLQTDWARYQFNAQPSGPSQDNTALTSPAIDLTGMTTGFASKSLYDYFGFPTLIDQAASGQHMNNYLARAYNFIWNTNYRDENLQTAAVVDLDNGPDSPADYVLKKRGKRFDKFTASLTAAQKGTPPNIPVGTSAPVIGNGTAISLWSGTKNSALWWNGTNSPALVDTGNGLPVGTATITNSPPNTGVLYGVSTNPLYSGLTADLSSAIGASLNQFRVSVAVQHLMEADARGGTRDVESIQHRWGVTVPDFRLQRPEYLGGQTFSFDGHVVPQTSETASTPQGNLTQFSQTITSMPVTHSFVEHGVFMILISARSNMTYQQGLKKDLSYRTRYDWYQPEFSNLGEVAVLSKEIYFDGTSADNSTFGFQEYAYELRYDENIVTSEMRSNYPQSLDMKHMAYDFSSRPTLSSGFIESATPISRNIVVDTDVADPIELNTLCEGMIARTLPMYSIPGLNRL